MSDDWIDWFPLVFFPLKIIVLGIAMFFSIKWHRDQDKAAKQKKEALEKQALEQQASTEGAIEASK